MENSFSYPKSSRLLQRESFVSLQQTGSFFSGRMVAFQWKRSSHAHPRLGITVTKRFGDAFERNRVKRLLREVFRLYILPKALPIDINVKPKSKALTADFAEIKKDFEYFLSCFDTGLTS